MAKLEHGMAKPDLIDLQSRMPSDAMMARDPIYIESRPLFGTYAPMICFNVVERHPGDRVTRQMGIIQRMPAALDAETRGLRASRGGGDLSR